MAEERRRVWLTGHLFGAGNAFGGRKSVVRGRVVDVSGVTACAFAVTVVGVICAAPQWRDQLDDFACCDLLHTDRVGYLCCYVAMNVGLQAVRDGKSGSHTAPSRDSERLRQASLQCPTQRLWSQYKSRVATSRREVSPMGSQRGEQKHCSCVNRASLVERMVWPIGHSSLSRVNRPMLTNGRIPPQKSGEAQFDDLACRDLLDASGAEYCFCRAAVNFGIPDLTREAPPRTRFRSAERMSFV
jgi:hypothetical protein